MVTGGAVAVPTIMLKVVGHWSSADHTSYVVEVTVKGTEVQSIMKTFNK